jgi:ribosome recycling factor
MPPLTEQTRRELTKQARSEAEHARVAVRNIRREANNDIKELVKEKMATEDEARRAEEQIQKLTDRWIVEVDHALAAKESDLLEV